MHIVHIASEMAPLAKVGGLADVLLGLCRELSWKGHDVDIIIPKYDCLDTTLVRDLHIEYDDLQTFYNGEWHPMLIWMGWVENLKVYFIDPHHPRHFFGRGCIYGCEDDIERYLCFCRAALEFMMKKQITPQILHLHDWQTAAIAPLYRDMYVPLGFDHSKIIATIHNMEYQGQCAAADLDKIGLNGKSYLTADKLQDNHYPQTINLLKGTIVYSDYVTTVSPTYAKEVLGKEGGKGMESTVRKFQNKFRGILNGIDYSYWNPEIDPLLPAHYKPLELPTGKKDTDTTIDKKAFIKKVLREELELAELHSPLVGCITRLVPQKGLDQIKHALKTTLDNGGQFVLLGSGPIPSVNAELQQLKQKYIDNPHVHLYLHHQERLAHLIYGGSDIFIVPSIFEPCGLTQMIALKYGSVPIVRRTGGLADTIFDVDYSDKPMGERNGYTFDPPTNEGIDSALKRAFHCWYKEPDKWRKLMITGMNLDHSWNEPSDLYLNIYKQLITPQLTGSSQ
jgi:starch synthase